MISYFYKTSPSPLHLQDRLAFPDQNFSTQGLQPYISLRARRDTHPDNRQASQGVQWQDIAGQGMEKD